MKPHHIVPFLHELWLHETSRLRYDHHGGCTNIWWLYVGDYRVQDRLQKGLRCWLPARLMQPVSAPSTVLLGPTKTVALETGGFGVTVNAICPAYVRTPLVERQIADQARTRGIPESDVVEKVMLEPGRSSG